MKIFDIFKLDKEIIEKRKQVKNLDLEIKKYTKSKKAFKLLIYKEIRKEKIEKKEILKLKGFEFDLVKKSFFDKFFEKKYNAIALYIGKDSQLKPIAVTDTITKTLDLFKTQKYVIADELNKKFKKIFYNGKRVFHLTPDYPINAEFDADKKKFFVDADTFNFAVNNVFDYQLTKPKADAFSIMGFIKKYWILLVFIIIAIIISQTEGGFSSALGLS